MVFQTGVHHSPRTRFLNKTSFHLHQRLPHQLGFPLQQAAQPVFFAYISKLENMGLASKFNNTTWQHDLGLSSHLLFLL